MQFTFQNPTKIIFGSGSLQQLGAVARTCGTKALLVTGGGSVKRNGTFSRAVASLEAAGISYAECSGVEPNPRLSSVQRGAATARAEGCDFVIALGGGSTMDAAKVMAAALYYEGDLWDMFPHGQNSRRLPEKALPVITVPTLAATGSEMNQSAVISSDASTIKSYVGAPCLYPTTAIVDPELTLTVPPDQTAYGICDLITHVTESYFNGVDGTPLQDRFAESVILTAMEWAPRVMRDGNNLEARAQIQWASVVALNGWTQCGTLAHYPVHMIEHTLSAHHDVAHGAGLAIVNPAWMRHAARHRPERFVQFAHRIFSIDPLSGPADEVAALGIDRFEDFLRSIGCPTRLSEIGLDESKIPLYAKDTILVAHDQEGCLPGRPAMTEAEIVDVLRSAR